MQDSARAAAVAAVRDGGFGHRELVVRANALDTRWGADDLAALSEAGQAAIPVPKVASQDELDRYNAAIAHAPAVTRLRLEDRRVEHRRVRAGNVRWLKWN